MVLISGCAVPLVPCVASWGLSLRPPRSHLLHKRPPFRDFRDHESFQMKHVPVRSFSLVVAPDGSTLELDPLGSSCPTQPGIHGT